MFILCPASTTQTLLVFVAAADASLPSSAVVALKTAAAAVVAANITAAAKALFPVVVLFFPFLYFPSPPLLVCLANQISHRTSFSFSVFSLFPGGQEPSFVSHHNIPLLFLAFPILLLFPFQLSTFSKQSLPPFGFLFLPRLASVLLKELLFG